MASAGVRTRYSSHRDSLSLGRELLLLGTLAAPVIVVAVTMESGRWVGGLPPLESLGLAGLALGFFLGRRGVELWKGALAGLVIGFGIASGFGFIALDVRVSLAGIGVVLMALAWLTGYATGWLAYRGAAGVLAAMPGAAAMLVLLGLLPEFQYSRMLFYVLASAPAIACLHTWRGASQGGLRAWLAVAAGSLALAAIALFAARAVPSPDKPLPFVLSPGLEEPFYSFWETVSKPLSAAPDRTVPLVTLPDVLPFTNPINSNDDVLFTIKSPAAWKLRTQVFETYTREGWLKPSTEPVVLSEETSMRRWVQGFRARKEAQITVRLHSRTDMLAFAGLPLKASIPARVTLSPSGFEGVLTTTGSPTALPPSDTGLGIAAAMSGDPLLAGPPLSLHGTGMLRPLLQYTTVGSVSEATEGQLRTAGSRYPRWIAERYLQLPRDFPSSVRDMAVELTRDAASPYQKAVALETFLRSLPYSRDVVPPPPGKDAVEYFLIEQRVGFCQYFASSMVTMLRSLGMPARLVVGFAPGTWNEARGVWEVRATDYHAWPEVYFPRYGWVEFEPTPAAVQPNLESLGVEESTDCDRGPEFCQTAGDAGTVEALFGGGTEEETVVGEAASPERPMPLWLLVVIALAAASGLASAALWYLRRARSRLGVAASTYGAMCLLGRLLGVPRRPHDTPHEYGARIAALLPSYDREITHITRLFTLSRYAPSYSASNDEIDAARFGWRLLRWAMLRTALLRPLGLVPWTRTGMPAS